MTPAGANAESTDRAMVVWTGLNPVAKEYGRRLRLYLNTRENPRPDVRIAIKSRSRRVVFPSCPTQVPPLRCLR